LLAPKRKVLWLLALLVAALALVAAGCGGDDEESGGDTTATETSGGGGGDGGKTVKIVSDLPLQGSDRVQTEQMVRAMEFILKKANNKAGPHTIEFESFDDATAAAGKWDEAKCAENARSYVDDESIVAVIGTYNSGCAGIEMPILNEVGLAMISPANTYAGLTHAAPGTTSGEPEKYFPSGERNYVRVVASDDNQGKIGAKYMKETLGVTKVFILDDKELYGKGVADAFEAAAKDIGLTVAGHEGWDKDSQNYRALMTKIKATGADGIYIGGVSANNGGQLVKDKAQIVGDNEKVKMIGSDGMVLSSLFDEAGKANVEGMYGTAPTQPPSKLTGKGKEIIDEFLAAEGGKPAEVYTVYAAACMQVALDAIGRSDGTREDVVAKLFETDIPDSVVGRLSFNEQGDPSGGTESVYKAVNGAWEFQETQSVG
jgi:branched-chain amino acid transport system substrate-binding protein